MEYTIVCLLFKLSSKVPKTELFPPVLQLAPNKVYHVSAALGPISHKIKVIGHGPGFSQLNFAFTDLSSCFYLYGNASCSIFQDFEIFLCGDVEIVAYFYLHSLPHPDANTAGASPGGVYLRNLILTGSRNSYAQYGILLRGHERVTEHGYTLAGLRTVRIENIDIFRTSFRAIEAVSVKGLKITNVACYTPKEVKSEKGFHVVIDGPDKGTANPSENVQLNGCSLPNVSIYRSADVAGCNTYGTIYLDPNTTHNIKLL